MRALEEILVLLAGVIDEREHAPTAPVGIIRAARGELAQDVLGAPTAFGNHRCASTETVKMLLVPLPRMFVGGLVIEFVIVGTSYQ